MLLYATRHIMSEISSRHHGRACTPWTCSVALTVSRVQMLRHKPKEPIPATWKASEENPGVSISLSLHLVRTGDQKQGLSNISNTLSDVWERGQAEGYLLLFTSRGLCVSWAGMLELRGRADLHIHRSVYTKWGKGVELHQSHFKPWRDFFPLKKI